VPFKVRQMPRPDIREHLPTRHTAQVRTSWFPGQTHRSGSI
jgi:hypothetical protein